MTVICNTIPDTVELCMAALFFPFILSLVYILVIYHSQSLNIKSGTLEKEQVMQAFRGAKEPEPLSQQTLFPLVVVAGSARYIVIAA